MTTTAIEPATIAQFTDSNRIISAVSFAILYYDFVLTIPQEVDRYWKRRLSWGSALFFLNRYSSVLSHIPIIYEYYWDVSQTLQFYHGVLAAIAQGIVALLMLVRGVVSVWAISQTMHDVYDPSGGAKIYYTGCILVLSKAQGQHYAIAWSAILVFDAVVFTLTLTRALRLGLAWRGGLFYVILRDGTMYFAILIICYLSNAITFVYGKPGYQGFLATFTNA
ncbi:hypothetical protein C8Q74DRAFT_1373916 [Fomes fomentarius]|nr:hypothetical protein C8Q74DRAFT_1373916 [Fomes fomentarius]